MTICLMRQLRDGPEETQRIDRGNASTENILGCLGTLKNGAFMEMEQVFKIHSTASKCLLAIHMGTEENVFYILRMQGIRYAERRWKEKWIFIWLGARISTKGSSPKTVFVIVHKGDLRIVFLKCSKYSVEKMENKTRVYVTLDLQPKSESILEIQRCYFTLEANPTYKGHVTWLSKAQLYHFQ